MLVNLKYKTQYLQFELTFCHETSPVSQLLYAPGSRPKKYLTLLNVADHWLLN